VSGESFEVRGTADVRAANAAFYAAFEARAVETMAALWSRSGQVVCTHPGWPTLHGSDAVQASWAALLRNDQPLQLIVTDERVQVHGDVGWVSCVENVLTETGPAGSVAALNLFVRERDGRWLMVAHHGSPVAPRV
jgi:uncharacterized protein (TIGR02246 family)